MKTALITGASGNLGQAVVTRFLDGAYKVSGTVRTANSNLPFNGHPDFREVAVDLIDAQAAREMVADLADRNGAIDVAVLTVGGFAMGDLASTGVDKIREQLKMNFETAWNVAVPVFEQMQKQGRGRIFLVGSKPGDEMRHSTGTVAYGLAKSLIFRLAELLNAEAGNADIVTSVIVPSILDTAQNRKAMPDADFNNWVRPETVAEIVWFYCSPAGYEIKEPIIRVYGNA